MLKFNSVRFKISFLYTAILGIILIIYSAFLYLSLHYTLYDELDRELGAKAAAVAGAISSYLDASGFNKDLFRSAAEGMLSFKEERSGNETIARLEDQWLIMVDKLDLKEDYIDILDASTGMRIASSANLPANLRLVHTLPVDKEGNLFGNIKYEKRDMRILSTPFSYKEKGGYVIQIATSLKPLMHILKTRLAHIGFSIPVILVIASFCGRLFARRILTPVSDITKTASKITHEDLSARVKTEHADEEMKYLVDAFNDMISRLEESFKYVAEFSSHVAHELKTPIAIIKGENEFALRKERTSGEYKKLINGNLEETNRMLKTINDLLLLTRLDYRTDVFKFERFGLSGFLWEIYEQTKMLGLQKKIKVTPDMPAEEKYVKGDKFHLRRLFFNILDNAIKFTAENGRIDVALRYGKEEASISISDTGIGIPPRDIPNIFNRFYRVDQGDQKIEHGSGLGLSISQSIARMHRGDIRVESLVNNGSTFIVTLPTL